MLGSYSVENGSLVFHPRFPPAPGVAVRFAFHSPEGFTLGGVFDPPPRRVSSTRVERVYPTTDLLPENQLKFYIFFSAPMSRGEAWQHIRLLDQNGMTVDLPFLELDQELWDREYKRLTVLFDPGRIKRGLVPLKEAGPAIEEGRQYTLVIDTEWRDARGATLEAGYRKLFHVGPPDRTPVDPARWRVTAPKAGTTDELVVRFPEPMDYALLMRVLEVPGVAGTASVGLREMDWRFRPAEPWRRGAYRVEVDTALEDLAGNHIGRAFDVDTFEKVSEHLVRKTVSLPFRVGENKR